MKKILLLTSLGFFSFIQSAIALPGQSAIEVAVWIRGNPTFSNFSQQMLTASNSDTAAKRLMFQASLTPPGRGGIFSPDANSGLIRSERMVWFDMINGVTKERLAESLRDLYGASVYYDYQGSQVVYTYPDSATLDAAVRLQRPLLAAMTGELRVGSRFAYWVELVNTDQGLAYNGYLTIFLKEDLPELESQLRNRI